MVRGKCLFLKPIHAFEAFSAARLIDNYEAKWVSVKVTASGTSNLHGESGWIRP